MADPTHFVRFGLGAKGGRAHSKPGAQSLRIVAQQAGGRVDVRDDQVEIAVGVQVAHGQAMAYRR